MPQGMNRVMLIGNVGADPELKVTPTGQSVLKIRLATTESYVDKTGERQERTDWHSVTVWGKRGSALSKFVAKGMGLFVEGRVQTRAYEKNGEKRYATDIVASNIILMSRKDAGSTPNQGAARPAPPPAAPAATPDESFGYDEEIPF